VKHLFILLFFVVSAFAADQKIDLAICGTSDGPTGKELIDAVRSMAELSGHWQLSNDCSDRTSIRVMMIAVKVKGNIDGEVGAAVSIAFVGRGMATGGALVMPFFAPTRTLGSQEIPYYLGGEALFEPVSHAHSDSALKILNELSAALR
jgi:hypothetical protein